jgi:chromosome partitioning protein
MMRTIAIANPRAGSGKTATTHALGMIMAERGWRVLLVDLDPQASLTTFCGIESTAGASLAEVLGGALPGPVAMWDILREVVPGTYLFLAPADLAMASTELGLASRIGREMVVRKILSSVGANFDIALIDCPSTLSLLTVNALTAAGGGVGKPTRRHHARPVAVPGDASPNQAGNERHLDLLGILLSPFDPRLNHHRTALQAMRAARLPLLAIGPLRSPMGPEEEETASYFPTDTQAQAHLAERVEKWVADTRP